MNKTDIIRDKTINNLINESFVVNETISISLGDDGGVYREIIPINEISGNVQDFIDNIIDNKLDILLERKGYSVDYENLERGTTNLYDGYELKVPIKKSNRDVVEDFFNEIDEELNNQNMNPNLKNPTTNVPLGKEPNQQQLKHLPNNIKAKKQKTQNPKKVDMVLKNVFSTKFGKYTLTTDAGKWKPIVKPEPNGKLFIVWENNEATNIKIECLLFPNDTNKIEIFVKNRQGVMLIKNFLEIYRIPTNEFIAEKFFRKTFFNLLKKFVDSKVILMEPFVTEFIFWKSDNPTYSYSFSSPNKNKIILDLISFINTAQKPILDDFFEQNNLKHKQGYLQTLLDSAEAAGIFRFKREGNEIIILRGPNYKAFLEGKVRRVM